MAACAGMTPGVDVMAACAGMTLEGGRNGGVCRNDEGAGVTLFTELLLPFPTEEIRRRTYFRGETE